MIDHRIFKTVLTVCLITSIQTIVLAHGTVLFPKSRMYRVRFETDDAEILQIARDMDANSSDSYYTWNQCSLFIPAAAGSDMSTAFDYSRFVPNGKMASGNHRFDNWAKNGGVVEDGLDFTGLDIVSDQWPATQVQAGQTITLDFLASAPHSPSVFDVWITTQDWNPNTPLNWNQMQVIGEFWNRHSGGSPLDKYGDRVAAQFTDSGEVVHGISSHYTMDVNIPSDLSGRHVLWVAWQRDDPAGEVFFSASDLIVTNTVNPQQLTVFRGVQISGDINDLNESDDTYAEFQPGITLSSDEPPVWLIFEGTLPAGNDSSLSFLLEAGTNTNGLNQTIEMFNWNTDQFEAVDSQSASFGNDSAISVDLSDRIADFVEPGGSQIKARTGWKSNSPVLLFPWTVRIDHVAWMVN